MRPSGSLSRNARRPGTGRLRKAVIVAVLTGLFGLGVGLSPVGFGLEASSGLGLLFNLRGHRRPPALVVIVSEDERSAADLGLPPDPRDWPRSYHTRLIRTLIGEGAKVIAFDHFFAKARSGKEDQGLAEAIGEAGNVVLTGNLEKQEMTLKDAAGRVTRHMSVEKLVTPAPALAREAISVAPFPLPKVPVTVSRYWTVKPGVGLPTLPLVALQVYALPACTELVSLLKAVRGRAALRGGAGERAALDAADALIAMNPQGIRGTEAINQLARSMRAAFGGESPLAGLALDALDDPTGPSPRMHRISLLRSLVNAYRDGNSRYLNYYGPARTITTVRYAEVLQDKRPRDIDGRAVDFRGKVVFVGESNVNTQRRGDEYHTFYSGTDGLDLSGVEIAATAFSNLWECSPVRPLGFAAYALVLAAFGLLAGAVCYLLGPIVAVLCVGVLVGLYLSGSAYGFMQSGIWLPVIVPAAIQAPFAFIVAVLWKYIDARKVEAAHERLKEIDRLKTLFLSQVSHELKTPLSSIKGFVDNMLDGLTGELRERQREYLLRVRANANRLSRMISNLLDLSRIESGTQHLERAPRRVCALVEEAVTQFHPIAEARRLTLEVTCTDPTVSILADHDKFIQVITNLVDNAVKFTPPGGRITAAVARREPDRVEVAVCDSGSGIPAGVTAGHLFEPFYQVGQRTDSQAAGLGLGLSIVKTLVELHDGTISVVSEEGKGAEFRILLPVVKEDGASGPGQLRGPGASSPAPAGEQGGIV